MSEPIEGEVVDPGKVIICERGKADSARAQMDRRGEYGGVVRESETCPTGQVVVVDTDLIQAALDERTPQWQATPGFGLIDPTWRYRVSIPMPSPFKIPLA